jgi:Ca2+-binding RTX toxin-like protein/pimeloyl-ACP methyl ester carboxylesterase
MSDNQNFGFGFSGADASIFGVNQLADIFGAVKGKLQQAAASPDLFVQVFGDKANTAELRSVIEEWRGGIFSQLPSVQVISAADMNGADGAYASSTQKIYLSDALFQSSAAPVDSVLGVARVLTEETFHWLDDRVGTDTNGDEGELGSGLLFGVSVSDSELLRIKSEDDRGFINVAGQSVIVEQASIFGNNANNTLYGTNSDDVIYGNNGNDTIYASGGNDSVYGGFDNDSIDGGDGNDKLWGENGDDKLWGGVGDDSLWGGFNNDSIDGGAGNDKLWGENGDDKLWGGSGDDNLSGGFNNDIVSGGSQNDSLWGENGDDKLYGDENDDKLWGGSENDFLSGGSGNDSLWGESGNDQLVGDDGNDSLNGYGFDNNEQDTLTGGNGSDRFYLGDANNSFYAKNGGSDFAVITDFNRSQDFIHLKQLSLDVVSSTQAWGYRLFTVGANTEIRLDSNGDTIAVLKGISGLNITGQGFVLEGQYELKKSLIANLYENVLGRSFDPGGMQTWTDALSRGWTLGQVRNAFAYSVEAQNLITKLYKDIFERTNVGSGMQTWTNALASGWTVTQVRNAIAHSTEAQNLITKLYKDIFDRTNVGGGMQTWTGALGSGWTLAQVRNAIGQSDEARRLVTDLYRSILGRVPDANGLQSWMNALSNGLTLAQVRSNFISSDEAKKIQQVGIWRGEYFNNRDLDLRDYSTFARIDGAIDNDWGNGGPGNGVGNDNFSIRWTGKFNFSSGNYIFHAKADDGVRLWIDGNLVIDQWKDQGATDYTAIRNLTGVHQVKVEYYENGGGAVAKVWWDRIIPPDNAGNSIGAAYNFAFPVGSFNVSRQDWIGSADTDDYYRFEVSTQTNFSLTLNGLSANADVELLDNSNRLIFRSANSGNSSESITQQLGSGTYYARVYAFNGNNTTYNLSLTGTALSQQIRSGSSNVNLWLYDKDGRNTKTYIDPNKETYIVIHGWQNNDTTSNIANLATTLVRKYSDAQVLAIDWGSITQAGLDWEKSTPYNTAKWIAPVARWAKQTLDQLQIKADSISLIGHSLGAYVSSEIAGLFAQVKKVKNITALDPAFPGGDSVGSYDIDEETREDQRARNFRDVAQNSYAYVVSDRDGDQGLFGDNDKAATANDSFIMRFTTPTATFANITHGGVVWAFTNMIDRGLILPSYRQNWYDKKGYKLSSVDSKYGHEGVILVSGDPRTDNYRVNSMLFINSEGIERLATWS